MSLFNDTKSTYQLVGAYILFIVVIFIMTLFMGCDSGWSVCGWEVK